MFLHITCILLDHLLLPDLLFSTHLPVSLILHKVEVSSKDVLPSFAQSFWSFQLLQQLNLASATLLACNIAMEIDSIEEGVAQPASEMVSSLFL